MSNKPVGIRLLFWLYLIVGILSLIWGVLVLGVGGVSSLFGNLFGAENIASFGQSSAWSGYISILAAIVQIVVAFGLAALQKWSWYLAVFGAGLTVIEGIFGMFTGGVFGWICGSMGLLIPVIVLIYLLQKNTRNVFGL